jgi:23S rRNA (adenine1618-N6)-methyltransferase
MPSPKKNPPAQKSNLHPRNLHRARYDFPALISTCPKLAPFVKLTDYGDESIDFFNPDAVKMLNKALLQQYYGVNYWDIPPNYLCPPVPGRADYIHYMADVLGNRTGETVKCMDIGVGANCIYPIIGQKEYGWSFIGTDIDPIALASAEKIVEKNPFLHGKIELRLQKNPKDIFLGVLKSDEIIDLTICNPPFHSSLAEANAGSIRKLTNLTHQKNLKPTLNFGGKSNELWCEGGEITFIYHLIRQSAAFSKNCHWFSTLVAKSAHLENAYKTLKTVGARDVKTIEMGQGNKISRILVWRF